MELNIKDIIHLLLKRWWLLLVCTVVAGTGAYVWTTYYLVPVYEANTTLYVGKNADERGVNPTDLNIGASVILDYREIAKSRLVASTVISELGLTEMSVNHLAGTVSVAQRIETRVIQITYRSTNPELAMIITNKVAEVFQKKIKEIMMVENVQVIDKAELPSYPVSPDKRRNLMLGIIIGLAIGIGIAFLINLLDDTLKTPEDIKKYIDLPVIGIIPSFNSKRRGA